jgi:hypothetical protein
VKTAISVPDATFERAERRAHELGLSRSDLYSTAVAYWLDALDDRLITEQIDQALATAGPGDEELAFLSRAGAGLVGPRPRNLS